MSSKNVWDLLQKRYPADQYALMAEVSDAAGFSRSRSADFMAMGLWPSRGLAVIGIELKSFRSDWLRELKDPKKAENIFQYCDYFNLLTTDDTIAKIEEIPPTWGWLCIKGDKIITKKEAPQNAAKPLSKGFVACMLKRAADRTGFVHSQSIQALIDQARQMGEEGERREIERLKETILDLNKTMQDFKQASGVEINRWHDIGKIGRAVGFIVAGGTEDMKKELQRLQYTAKTLATKAETILAELEQVTTNDPNTHNDHTDIPVNARQDHQG